MNKIYRAGMKFIYSNLFNICILYEINLKYVATNNHKLKEMQKLLNKQMYWVFS